MQARADQGHLLVKGIEQVVQVGSAQAAAQQLGPLAQQAAVAAEQFGVDRLQLQHDPVEPLAPQGWFTPHQLQIQGAEAHAAQGTNQVQLAVEQLAVAAGLAAPLAPQFQFEHIGLASPRPGVAPAPCATTTEAPHQGGGLPLLDQVPVAAAAVGAQAAQQLHRFEQVGLALAIAANHEQARRFDRQAQLPVVAEVVQLQAMQPNGSGAVCGLR